jgi:hypothetical protein
MFAGGNAIPLMASIEYQLIEVELRAPLIFI